jgi:hypothetical protein
VAPAIPSIRPTTLALTLNVCVRKSGRTGTIISVEISAKRLDRASRKVLRDRPLKYPCAVFIAISLLTP